MATLRKIAHQIADSINRPFDDMLYYRLRDYIIQEAAFLMQQTMDKDGVDKQYVATSIVPMKIVNASELSIVTDNKKILRSVDKIHTPIRYKNYIPFVYVGIRDGSYAFSFSNFYSAEYHHCLPLVGETITYDYIDNYLYVFNTIKLDEVRISAVYPMTIFDTFRSDITAQQGECYVDNMEFPLALDQVNILITRIKQYLLNPIDLKDAVPNTHTDNN